MDKNNNNHKDDEVFVYKGGKQKVPKDVVRVRIAPTVKVISPIAFKDCPNLKYVEFSEGLQKIGCFAFSNCKSLQYVRLPSCTRSIALGAFENCVSIQYLVLNYGLEQISQSSFSGCTALQYVFIPSTVMHLGSYAFVGCTTLQEVALNQGPLSKIHYGTFQWCTALKMIGVPFSVKSIAEDAIPETAIQNRDNASEFWREVYLKVQESADAFVEEEEEASMRKSRSTNTNTDALRAIRLSGTSTANSTTNTPVLSTPPLGSAKTDIQLRRESQRSSGKAALLAAKKERNDDDNDDDDGSLQKEEVTVLRTQVQDLTSKLDHLNGIVEKLQRTLEAVSEQGKETQAQLERVLQAPGIWIVDKVGGGDGCPSSESSTNSRRKRLATDTTDDDGDHLQVRESVIMLTKKMDQVMTMIQTQGYETRSELHHFQKTKDHHDYYDDDDEVTPKTVTVKQEEEEMSDDSSFDDDDDDDDDRSFY